MVHLMDHYTGDPSRRIDTVPAGVAPCPTSNFMKTHRLLSLIAVTTGVIIVPTALHAASLNWDTAAGDGTTLTGGAGTWDTSSTNWNLAGANIAWVNANKDLAVFSGTTGTVTLGSDITASGITLSSGYTIAGGGFTLTLDNGAGTAVIRKDASGTISANLASSGAVSITGNSNLSLTGTNTGLTGTVSLSGPNTVTLGNSSALGTAAVTIAAGSQPAMGFGGAFTLNNAVTLGSGSSLWTAGSNPLVFGNNVSLAGNAGMTLWNQSARITGTLGLAGNNFTVAQSGTGTRTLTLAGPVTGTGGIVMNAANNKTLILSNTDAPNTYSGGTTITAGTVSLGTGGTSANTSHVGALGTGAVAINTGGTLRLWIKNDASFSIANNLTINGGTLRNEDGNHTISGTVSIGTSGATFQAVYSGKNLSLGNTISGNGPVTIQAGSGQVRMTGANTYNGSTTVSTGTLLLSNANASSGFSIASGATLALRSITLGPTQNITGAGAVTKDISTFGDSTINGSNNTYTGATTVNISRFSVGSSGVINGTSGISVLGQWDANFNNQGSVTTPGNITIAGTGNTTSGGVTANSSFFRNSGTVNAANLVLNSSGVANTTANRGGTYAQSAGSTTLTGALTLAANGGTGAAGTAGNDAAFQLFGGTFSADSVAVNAGTFSATGGSVTANTITVAAGAVFNAAGSALIHANVTTSAGSTLTGNGGTFDSQVTINGTHSPGASPGLQTFTAGLTYGASATLEMELVGDILGIRGTDFDAIDLTGGILDIHPSATLDLVAASVDYTAAIWNHNRSFTLIDSSGTASFAGGLFQLDTTGAGAFATEGAWSLSSAGGDVVLNWTTVPEPGVASIGGIGLLLLLRRRRG